MEEIKFQVKCVNLDGTVTIKNITIDSDNKFTAEDPAQDQE